MLNHWTALVPYYDIRRCFWTKIIIHKEAFRVRQHLAGFYIYIEEATADIGFHHIAIDSLLGLRATESSLPSNNKPVLM